MLGASLCEALHSKRAECKTSCTRGWHVHACWLSKQQAAALSSHRACHQHHTTGTTCTTGAHISGQAPNCPCTMHICQHTSSRSTCCTAEHVHCHKATRGQAGLYAGPRWRVDGRKVAGECSIGCWEVCHVRQVQVHKQGMVEGHAMLAELCTMGVVRTQGSKERAAMA